MVTDFPSYDSAIPPHPVIIDLTISTSHPSSDELDPRIWHRLEKDLCLYTAKQSAWLYVAFASEEQLTNEDLIVTDIRTGEPPPNLTFGQLWESRPGGIWLLRRKITGKIDQVVTEVDVLFGVDAVDPRPQWSLMQSPLQVDVDSKVPVARLSILRGRAKPIPEPRPVLRVDNDGKFKIVQISDTHMVTGVGVCKDRIDAHGNRVSESEADPLTVKFIEKVLDVEKPDLVLLTGDQLHHDIPDSKSALFKVVAPIIERSIPFAAVFGNHDSEGLHALSRTAQMAILQNLPLSLCEPGPEHVDGVGNYCLEILAPTPSERPLSALYLLDSHGQVTSKLKNPDYDHIKQSQIDWFVNTSQAQRNAREKLRTYEEAHLSLVFLHIPLPEFADRRLNVRSGCREEPTEGPSFNSHFYDALVAEGVAAIGCGHDHVNDFCALLPRRHQQNGETPAQLGPWLCYGGGSGFGGYCSYGSKRFHRRMRVWELDTNSGGLKTWKRLEYGEDRVDELVLVKNGNVVDSCGTRDGSRFVVAWRLILQYRLSILIIGAAMIALPLFVGQYSLSRLIARLGI